MAVNYPIMQSLTIDGITNGFDPEWGQGYSDEVNMLNPEANTWTDGASLILPKGMYIISWFVSFPAASSTGQTTYQSRLQIVEASRAYTETWVQSVSNANSKILSRVAELADQRTVKARFSTSRAISGSVRVGLYAIRLVDMLPNS